jgi:hypothetical protein
VAVDAAAAEVVHSLEAIPVLVLSHRSLTVKGLWVEAASSCAKLTPASASVFRAAGTGPSACVFSPPGCAEAEQTRDPAIASRTASLLLAGDERAGGAVGAGYLRAEGDHASLGPGGGVPAVRARVADTYGAFVTEGLGNADVCPVTSRSEAPVPIGTNVAPMFSIASLSGSPPTKKPSPKPWITTVSRLTPSHQYTRLITSVQRRRSARVMPT